MCVCVCVSAGHPIGATGLAQCVEICWQVFIHIHMHAMLLCIILYYNIIHSMHIRQQSCIFECPVRWNFVKCPHFRVLLSIYTSLAFEAVESVLFKSALYPLYLEWFHCISIHTYNGIHIKEERKVCYLNHCICGH